jgi:hypothetical protein
MWMKREARRSFPFSNLPTPDNVGIYDTDFPYS